MKNEKGPDAIPTEPTKPDRQKDAHYYLDASVLRDFRQRVEGSEKLLFMVLAERIRNGTLHHHDELTDYLASVCSGLASGLPPNEALGFHKGRPKKDFGDWLRCCHEIALVRALSDLSIENACALVSEKMIAVGKPIGVEMVKKHYKAHKSDFTDITKDNVHEHLTWINGQYLTPLFIKSGDLGAFAQEFEKELFKRVKKEGICLP